MLQISVKKEVLLGLFGAILLGINTVVGHMPFADIYFLGMVLLFSCLFLLPSLNSFRPILILISILSFPEYGPDPYNENFFSPFYYQKYLLIIFLVFSLSFKISINKLILLLLVVSSWLMSIYFGIAGNVVAEIFPLFIFLTLPFINLKKIEVNFIDFIISFSSFLIIASLIIEYSGIGNERMAARNLFNVYFFGHYWGILIGFFILNFQKLKISGTGRGALLTLFILSLAMNLNTFQSIHFIFILCCVFLRFNLFNKISIKSISYGILIIVFSYYAVPVILDLRADGNAAWAIMKIKQAASILTLNPALFGNSVLVRLNEIISIYEQSNLLQLLFGRGFASIYEIKGAFWYLSKLHETTFPIDQLASGKLQMVHETITLLFKWVGVVGLIFYSYFMNIILKSYNLSYDQRIFYLLLIFLFSLSGVHTGLLCFFLIMFSIDKNYD